MSLPAEPQQQKNGTSADQVANTTKHEVLDARSYLVMMLLAILALPTGLARAYRGEQAGWTRFWVFVGSYVTMIIPILNIIGSFVIIVLTVWGIVDIFTLRKTTTDASGKKLITTATDAKWARGVVIYFFVSLVLAGLIIAVTLSFAGWALYGNNGQALPTMHGHDGVEPSEF